MNIKTTETEKRDILDAYAASFIKADGKQADLGRVMEDKYMSEMDKLEQGLKDRGVEYDRHFLHGGEQIRCSDWDVICTSFSYGGYEGLLEVMGLPQCDDDVIGHLTAEEVLQMFDEKDTWTPDDEDDED